VRPPATAMVLAAGLGTRMRPLTADRPKALVEVGGRALIDHMLDRLAEAGVERAVVNVHAFADRLEQHLRGRTGAPALVISDERDALLETGGGIKRAAPLLGTAPVFTANIDAVWLEAGAPALPALAEAFDPERMDACLLVTRTDRALGLDTPGDFFMAEDGALRFRGEAARAPYAFCGVQVFKPALAAVEPDRVFSTSRVWRRLAGEGRLYGVELDGRWMHVGDPAARDAAEAQLRTSVAASAGRVAS
jgi:N-acetyl-alpha-D-muramate 1-phosphate uridylyltransferase